MHQRGARQKGPPTSTPSTALAAVAFQDHLVKSLSLDLPGLGTKKIPSRKKIEKKNDTYSKPWLQNSGKIVSKDPEPKEAEEYVLHSKQPQPLSLAEKFGFVETPLNPNLSENDWREVKTLAAERNDFGTPCPICKEDIGSQKQVLLSCSHVFHHNCLQSFERFVGRRSCPLCRKESYEARVVHEGTKGYKNRCAIKIQSAWRGYIVRCWYLNLRETLPPKDEKLRKAFYEKKLNQITDRLLKSVNYDVNRFLLEIDESLEASRQVFRDFDLLTRRPKQEDVDWEEVQVKAVMREVVDCPICIMPLQSHIHTDDDAEKTLDRTTSPNSMHAETSRNSSALLENNTEIDESSYASAFNEDSHSVPSRPPPTSASSSASSAATSSATAASSAATYSSSAAKSASSPSSTGILNDETQSSKTSVLLSCSHIFHKKCLESFEKFSLESKTCPICRSPYVKKTI